MCEQSGMSDAPATSVANLRSRLGMTLEAFAAAVELKSKGQASEIERTGKCSPEVALRIEQLSDGEIDAGTLNATIALARRPTPAEQEARAA